MKGNYSLDSDSKYLHILFLSRAQNYYKHCKKEIAKVLFKSSMWNTRRLDDSEIVYEEPITLASKDVVASAHNYTALGPLKGTSESQIYMSSPSDKESAFLPPPDPVGVPKKTVVIQGKKMILAFILIFLIVSMLALILGITSLVEHVATQSSDLARLDDLNDGLSSLIADLYSKLDSLNARVDTMNVSMKPYQGCYSKSTHCSLELQYQNLTSHCSTHTLPINVTVSSYTIRRTCGKFT